MFLTAYLMNYQLVIMVHFLFISRKSCISVFIAYCLGLFIALCNFLHIYDVCDLMLHIIILTLIHTVYCIHCRSSLALL